MIKHEPNKMPSLWWLFPWSYTKELKKALDAINELYSFERGAYENMKALTKQKDDAIASCKDELKKNATEIDEFYQTCAELSIARDEYKARHINALVKIDSLEKELKEVRARKSLWYPRPAEPKAKAKAKTKKKKAVRRG